MFDVKKARQFLQLAGVFYCDDPSELEDDDDPKNLQTLNMNDTWAWATGWGVLAQGISPPVRGGGMHRPKE